MFKLTTVSALFLAGLFLAPIHSKALAQDQSDTQKIRIGTFDSRAIAIAYYRSGEFQKKSKDLHKKLSEAKQKKDQAEVLSLQKKGRELQLGIHRQGFGASSVRSILRKVKDKIPAIAKKKNVQVVVSKWELVFSGDREEKVDVTDELVNLFSPSKETLKTIEEIQKKDLIPNSMIID